MVSKNNQPAETIDASRGAEANPLRTARLSFIGCGVDGRSDDRRSPAAETCHAGSNHRRHPRPVDAMSYKLNMVSRRRKYRKPPPLCPLRKSRKTTHDHAVVVLAVKPQRLGGVLSELKGVLHLEQMVVSIVAGARIEPLPESCCIRPSCARCQTRPRKWRGNDTLDGNGRGDGSAVGSSACDARRIGARDVRRNGEND